MTLDMAHVDGDPFTDFVENAASYARSRTFWLNSFNRTIEKEAAHWHLWMNDPLKDEHPIFSMIDEDRNQGVLLQQIAKTEDPFWFRCWMSKTKNTGGDVLYYLGIETFVSESSLLLFENVIKKWIKERRSYDEMLIIVQGIESTAQEDYERKRPNFIYGNGADGYN